MKKYFCALVLLATMVGGFLPRPVFAQVAPEVAHKSGSLVKIGSTIYVLSKTQKRGFKSWNEFLSYHYRNSRIVTGNNADKMLPEGSPMRAKPGTLALDTYDGRTVYLIGKQGQKQGLTSPAALQKYRKKNSVIYWIDLRTYPLGDNID